MDKRNGKQNINATHCNNLKFFNLDFLSSIYYIFMKKYLKYNKFRTYNVDKYDTNLIYKKKTFYLFLHHIGFWWSKYKL